MLNCKVEKAFDVAYILSIKLFSKYTRKLVSFLDYPSRKKKKLL